MNDPNTKPRLPHGQFSLKSLLAGTVFAALGLWAWRLSGFLGVVYLLVFISLVVANLGIAWWGATFRCPIVAGALGGIFLWSIVAVVLGILDDGIFWFEDSVVFAVDGILAGLVCGGYARLRGPQVDRDGRNGMIVCLVLFLAFATVFGLGRFLAHRRVVQPDFSRTISYEPDADGTYIVEFWGKGFADEMLSHQLGEIPKNRKLVLSFRHTRVTDAGIRVLGEYPNLERVDLRGTAVSENGEEWLRARLPSCDVRR